MHLAGLGISYRWHVYNHAGENRIEKKKSICAVTQINSVVWWMKVRWTRGANVNEQASPGNRTDREMSLKHLRQGLLLQTFKIPCLWIITLTRVKMSHKGGVLRAQWSQARTLDSHETAKSRAWIQPGTFIAGHFSLSFLISPVELI